jgi:Flp pilus assembly protein TadB
MIAVIIINLIVILMVWRYISALLIRKSINTKFETLHSLKDGKGYFTVKVNKYLRQTRLGDHLSINELFILYGLYITLCLLILALFDFTPFTFILLVAGLGIVPVICLDKLLERIDRDIDRGVFQFLSLINAKLMQSEDIIKAIKVAESELKNKSILRIVKVFNQTIKAGVPPETAFEKVQDVSCNEYLNYVFSNIEVVYVRRGNIVELMKGLENEFISIQVEVNRRKVAIEHERNMVWLSLGIVGFVTINIMRDHDYIRRYFENHYLAYVCVIMFALLGLVFMTLTKRIKY